MRVWGDPGGPGGSEKHIWKIFYRALFEIGTLGTLRGVLTAHIFFWKFFSGKVIRVYVARFRGCYGKKVILGQKMGIEGYVSRRP